MTDLKAKRQWAADNKHLLLLSPTGCLNWGGKRDPEGYGLLHFEGKRYRAHRFFYTVYRGVIAEGLVVCHECDNKGCVNPAHLSLGTMASNMKDAWLRGLCKRSGSHEPKTHCKHGHALTPDNIVQAPSMKHLRRCRKCFIFRKRERYWNVTRLQTSR